MKYINLNTSALNLSEPKKSVVEIENFRFTFYRIEFGKFYRFQSFETIGSNDERPKIPPETSNEKSRHVSIKLCARKWKILIKFSSFRSARFTNTSNQYEFEYAPDFSSSALLFHTHTHTLTTLFHIYGALSHRVCDSYNFCRKLNQFKLCVCSASYTSLSFTIKC